MAYVLIFFNLNVVHDYYQIPLLAVTSLLIARGLGLAMQIWGTRFPVRTALVAVVGFAALAFLSIRWTERSYYHIDWMRVEAGKLIDENTPSDALIVAATSADTDPRDPRILQRAHRYGWSIHRDYLTPDLLHRLRKLGATHLVLVVPEDDPATEILGIKGIEKTLERTPWKLLIAPTGP